MKVWVVETDFWGEGYTLDGVFGSSEKAKQIKQKILDEDKILVDSDVRISEIEVEQ